MNKSQTVTSEYPKWVDGVLYQNEEDADNAESTDETGGETPPTREEMEIKAKELGLEFHHKLGDAKLLKLINDELAK